MTHLHDDEGNVQFQRRLKTWEKRLAALSDEILVFIIQCATHQLNIRNEKGEHRNG